MVYLMDIFERYKNEIYIEYEFDKSNKEISLFGSKFVENNNKSSFIMINRKISNLKEKYEINEGEKIKNLKVNLFMDKKITNVSEMFRGCLNLLTLSDASKWNTYNINDMSYMFSGCSNLISLFDISKWNTNNVTNMKYLFSECTSLLSIPDISKWSN